LVSLSNRKKITKKIPEGAEGVTPLWTPSF